MMVFTLKHAGAVLMLILMKILKLFLRQFNCASVGNKTLIVSRCMVHMWKKKLSTTLSNI